MKYRKIGNSELSVSMLGLGSLHFGGYLNERYSNELISYALHHGINFIDTGPLYGNGLSESIVGRAIRGRRDKVVLSTKVGLSRRELADGSFGVEVVPLTCKQIRMSLDMSLRELGTDYVDIFQFHAYDDSTLLEESFGTMNRLITEGKIRSIAVSNYSPSELKSVLNVIEKNSWQSLVAIETHYNLIERMAEHELLPLCQKNQVSVIPYRSLARGILTGKYDTGVIPLNTRAADSWRVRQWLLPETLSLVTKLSDLAKENGRTVTELALAWLYMNSSIGSVLIGARDIEQLELCLNSCSWELDNNILNEIERLIDLCEQREHVDSHPTVYFEK
jgi:aryl-alcohol dehydrogenase-like predicted oxidoreductase